MIDFLAGPGLDSMLLVVRRPRAAKERFRRELRTFLLWPRTLIDWSQLLKYCLLRLLAGFPASARSMRPLKPGGDTSLNTLCVRLH